MERNRRNSRMNETHSNMRNDRSGRSMRAHQPAGREYENQYIGSEPRRGEYGSQRSQGRDLSYRSEMSRPQFGDYSRQSYDRNDDRQFDQFSQEDSLSTPYREQNYDNQRTFMSQGREDRRQGYNSMNGSFNSRPQRPQNFDSSYGYDEIEDGSYEHSQHDMDQSSRRSMGRGARPYSQMSSDWGRQDEHHDDYRLNGYSSSTRDFQPREEHHDSIDYGSRRLGSQQTFGTYGSDISSQGGRSLTGRDSSPRSMGSSLRQDAFGADSSSHTSFRGKGPKGFKRSDERIKEQVCDILEQDHSIDASEIDVDVKDGEVTLSGTVTSREDKRLAEELIEDCAGVKEVINNIRTTPRASAQTTGAQTSGLQSRTDKSESNRTDSTSSSVNTYSAGTKSEKEEDLTKSRNLDKTKTPSADKINQSRLS